MPSVALPRDVAQARYPEQFYKLTHGLDLEHTTFMLDWTVLIPSLSFNELLAEPREAREQRTVDEKVQDYARRTTVMLVARCGRRRRTERLEEVPEEILGPYRARLLSPP